MLHDVATGLRQRSQHLLALRQDGKDVCNAGSRVSSLALLTSRSVSFTDQKGRGYATTAVFYFGGLT